jgi:NAD(P)-dependent dehydrogenase (short-subunit alcohol dehydrogenase family)
METLRIGPLGFRETPFLDVTPDQWAELVDAIEAAVLDMGRFARDTDGQGRIVVVSSAASARAIEGCTLDAVAGAFLTTVAQVAALELRPRGITANVVVPARPPDEQTVAAVVDFLVSEQAAGVTGAVIAADGGFSVTKEPGGKPPPSGRG